MLIMIFLRRIRQKGKVKKQVDENSELVYDAGRDLSNEGQTNLPGIRFEGKDHRRIVHLGTEKRDHLL